MTEKKVTQRETDGHVHPPPLSFPDCSRKQQPGGGGKELYMTTCVQRLESLFIFPLPSSRNQHRLYNSSIDTPCTIAVIVDGALRHVNGGSGGVDTIHGQVESVDPAASVVLAVDEAARRTPRGAVRVGPAGQRAQVEDLGHGVRGEVEAVQVV